VAWVCKGGLGHGVVLKEGLVCGWWLGSGG
jgi:hypothetical protein